MTHVMSHLTRIRLQDFSTRHIVSRISLYRWGLDCEILVLKTYVNRISSYICNQISPGKGIAPLQLVSTLLPSKFVLNTLTCTVNLTSVLPCINFKLQVDQSISFFWIFHGNFVLQQVNFSNFGSDVIFICPRLLNWSGPATPLAVPGGKHALSLDTQGAGY